MGKYFGTDGFRGKVNQNLTAIHAYQIGRFLGWYYGQTKKAKIVIGKDTRISSYMLEYALSTGITASGADAYLLHVTTTPSVSYVAAHNDFDCGVMISASHNPYYDNGIKLINCNGEKMEDSIIQQLESYLEFPDKISIPLAIEENIGKVVDYTIGRENYVQHLISVVDTSFSGKKIALDCANGSAWSIAPYIFRKLDADVYVLHDKPNGTNINQDSGSTHIKSLQEYVLKNHLDAGFAFDGDADRCIAVDQFGQIIDGDRIMYICARYLKERGQLANNMVVTTVMSNFGLYKALDKLDIQYAKTPVGDKYVYDYMRQNNDCIGGEQSGHIIFSQYARTGDGILTALKLMEIILDTKTSLNELAAPMKIYPQVLRNLEVTDKDAVIRDRYISQKIQTLSEKIGNTGRILVRQSGTEPLVRVMVEAEDIRDCERICNEIVEEIGRRGYIISKE